MSNEKITDPGLFRAVSPELFNRILDWKPRRQRARTEQHRRNIDEPMLSKVARCAFELAHADRRLLAATRLKVLASWLQASLPAGRHPVQAHPARDQLPARIPLRARCAPVRTISRPLKLPTSRHHECAVCASATAYPRTHATAKLLPINENRGSGIYFRQWIPSMPKCHGNRCLVGMVTT